MTVPMPEGYDVRRLTAADAVPLAAALRRNRDHLAPFDPPRRPDFFTDEGQAAAVAEAVALVDSGGLRAWVLWHGDEVVGRVNLNNVVRGAWQNANLGYWVAADHQGRGLATAAVRHAVAEAEAMGLHRLEAGTLRDNAASQAVLRRCGFSHFGTAERYLFIAGAWRDHHLYQRILHDRPL